MAEYTRFSALAADKLKAPLDVYVASFSTDTISHGTHAVYALTASAASKKYVLGLPDGTAAIVANVGSTNAFTLKNVPGDSGTSVATGKVYLVIASETANASKFILLNDGAGT